MSIVRVLATHFVLAAAGSEQKEQFSTAFREALRYDADAQITASAIEETMWSSFQALPKNEYGRLDVHTAGYAMQRYFNGVHGSRITGLQHESFFHADVEEATRPMIADALAEADTKKRGFSLGELTKLTQVLESFVKSEESNGDVEFHDSCAARKESLVKLSQPNTGRVQLDAFSDWSRAEESIASLQEFGAASAERLLIANYMVHPSNCKSAGKLHAVCCKSECLPILAEIEGKVLGPMASPDRLLRLVTSIAAPTPVKASKQLAEELYRIAESHGGDVPIHNEAFAQWLHRAFPNECPSPALLHPAAATAGPFYVTDWLRTFDVSSFLPALSTKDIGRLIVLGAIIFTMLRTVLTQVGAASTKMKGGEEDAKKPLNKERLTNKEDSVKDDKPARDEEPIKEKPQCKKEQ